MVRETAEKNNEVIEIDSDDEDEPRKPDISHTETINLCEKLMEACLQHGDSSSDLPLNLLTHHIFVISMFAFVRKSFSMPDKPL